MTDPIRAALERLVARLDETTDPNGPVPAWSDSFYAAQAALSADGPAVPEGREPAAVVTEPSDVDLESFLLDVAAEHGDIYWAEPLVLARAVLARYSRQPAPPAEALAARPLLEQVARMGDCIGANTVGEIMAISDRAAAWLAANPPGKPIAIEPRGCPTPGACSCVQPAPPAEGEVGELVADLQRFITEYGKMRGLHPEHIYSIQEGIEGRESRLTISQLARIAAELLQRHPAPVPVSERLPGPEDCLDEGWAWFFNQRIGWRQAVLPVSPGFTHWLPAQALPLPAGEVE